MPNFGSVAGAVAKSLAGKTIVVTRPLAQATELASGIEAAGGRALIFPLLEISPAADLQPLRNVAARLADYHVVIFISPNAVTYSLPTLLAAGPWPANLTPAAIGPGTVKALTAQGINHCLAPAQRFDSEGLLAEAALASRQVTGKKILILRGNGGRELLAETLAARGAQIDCITCYQRSAPESLETLCTAWQNGEISALTLSSSEALRHLVDQLDAEGRRQLAATPVFVPHPRIAETALACGLQHINLTEAADAGILSGLLNYHWPA